MSFGATAPPGSVSRSGGARHSPGAPAAVRPLSPATGRLRIFNHSGKSSFTTLISITFSKVCPSKDLKVGKRVRAPEWLPWLSI